ncbi:trypsin-like serine protease [Candidatus Paracaedibacter symbiosus]|uniref:trypsin-like serine protease n=1 Tax=Candidatus Paracaedibacter symbiosus TaxID=244582 RepID=UPI0005095E1E|nr:trypsin-like serine protease [Candidatus Paracaedibacter symbiosus]
MKKMLFGFILFGLIATPGNASTYLDDKGLEEGIRRGTQEKFTSSTGQIIASLEDDSAQRFNGVLVTPSLVLTPRHCIHNTKITDASFIVYPKVDYAIGKLTSGDREFAKYGSRLDLENIQLPSDQSLDLALVPLKRPIENVEILPLNLEKPKSWTNGFLVSYASAYILGNDQPAFENQRHIAVFDVQEKDLDIANSCMANSTSSSATYLVKPWELTGNPYLATNREFIPAREMHRLTALTAPSDSGGPFITNSVSRGFMISGIHRGRMVINEKKTSTSTITPQVYTSIIPLYPHKEWIESVITKFQ